MKTVRLIDESVGPGGGRIVPALGNLVIRLGEGVEVPDDVAGHAPSEYTNDDDVVVSDLGSGLLAQSDVWVEA